MPYAEINGQRIYHEDSGGQGFPLVLAHGFLMDHEMFAPQVAELGSTHRLVTWDERGHGQTETTAEDFTYWDSAEDLRGLLDTLGIARAVVGGMSQGGFLSMRFALRYPERVVGLVLLDTESGLEDPEKLPQYEMMTDVWATEGPSDMIADTVAAIIIGPGRPESPAWMAKWKARPKGGRPAGLPDAGDAGRHHGAAGRDRRAGARGARRGGPGDTDRDGGGPGLRTAQRPASRARARRRPRCQPDAS